MEQPAPSRGQVFVINLIGAIGLVFGVVPILAYLLDLDFASFALAPYAWLELDGAARYLPPAMVLVVCGGLAFWLERRATRA
jgi:hypothetical protein